MPPNANQCQTIVFLGPTLPLCEAKQIFSKAIYLPPVSCGDVLRALRLKPKHIAIIDGFFENTAAVWHKEILLALEKKVQVFGASSMGALRAAELAKFGMQGNGKIFAAYHEQTIVDDDEVAILHGPKQSNYLALTDAMVNIRATLSSAAERKIVSQKTAALLCKIAKEMPYRDRTFTRVLEFAQANRCRMMGSVFPDDLMNFQQWLDRGGYIDQKRIDAIALLKHIAALERDNSLDEQTLVNMPVNGFAEKANRTAFLRVLQKRVSCRPFHFHCDEELLPMAEKVARYARYLGDAYLMVRRLAYLLAAGYALVQQKRVKIDAAIAKTDLPFLQRDFSLEYDCDGEEKKAFFFRINLIEALINHEEKHLQKALPSIASREDYFFAFMRLANDYQKYREIAVSANRSDAKNTIYELYWKMQPIKARVLYYMASLWRVLENQKGFANLVPQRHIIQEYSNKFRKKYGLILQKDAEIWLKKNDLDLFGYQNLICNFAKFSFLILQNNLDILNIAHHEDDVWWLKDALWLTGLYSEAKKLLQNPEQVQAIKEKALQLQNRQNLDEYAYSLDFFGRANEFLNN